MAGGAQRHHAGAVTSDPRELTVRPEEDRDWAVIAEVVTSAFGSPLEARLVEAIRRSDDYIPSLALVATLDGVVVGHVMVSGALLVDGAGSHRIATLAPLAVAPSHHRRGIGGALVRAVVAGADALGEPLIVLEGSPSYYGRFGFEPAAICGIRINLPDWAPEEAAQVRKLGAYRSELRGLVTYSAAFADVIGAPPSGNAASG